MNTDNNFNSSYHAIYLNSLIREQIKTNVQVYIFCTYTKILKIDFLSNEPNKSMDYSMLHMKYFSLYHVVKC